MKKARYITPAVTAFTPEGALDREANRHIWAHLVDGGIDGIVVLGSIGEFYALSMDDKRALIDEAMAHAKPYTQVYAGTGGMTVAETIALSNYALDAGVDAALIISPYYFALSDADVEAFYDEVATHVRGPIYLYNFPDRTGYDLSPRVTLRLLRRHSHILGYKDTVSQVGHTRALLNAILPEFPDFLVLSGFDEHFTFNLLGGGAGCISGLSNIDPALFAAWVRAMDMRAMDEAAWIQRAVNRMMDIYAVATPFIPAIKRAMQLRGVPLADACQAPLSPVSPAQAKEIAAILEDVDAIMRGEM